MLFNDVADELKTHYKRGIGRLLYSTNRIAEPQRDDSDKKDGVWMATSSSRRKA